MHGFEVSSKFISKIHQLLTEVAHTVSLLRITGKENCMLVQTKTMTS